MPRLDVLLPFRNAARTLDDALASVLGEPWDGVLLAVDDGSTAGSDAVVARWARLDARVVPLTSVGRGIVAALGTGLRVSRAEIVARMDADDVSAPGRLARTAEALAGDASLGAVACQVRAVPEGAVGEGLRRYVAWQNALLSADDHARAVFVESPLCHPATALRRAALDDVGGFRDVPWAEDWDLWLRMTAAGHGLAKVAEVLFDWRHLPGRLTFTDPRYAPARMVEARAHYLADAVRGRPLVVWGAGQTGRRLARALEGNGMHIHAFIDIDPQKIGRRARGAPILSCDDALAARPRDSAVVAAVGARGARELVRAELLARGLVELEDFFCAA